MSRYVFTEADRAKSNSSDSAKLRRQIEKALLDRMLAEAAMPEWYPHQ